MRTFLSETLGRTTAGNIYIVSLPNDDTIKPGEKHISSRDLDAIEAFVAEWDQVGRGLFFCVSTIAPGKKRKKDNALASIFLHADIDLKDIEETAEEVVAALENLEYKPSRINNSGRGLHAYWELDEESTDSDRISEDLKKLSKAVAGDIAVTHRVALMRLPGSHNTKNDGWLEVKTVFKSDIVYTLEELEGWLDSVEPLFKRKTKPKPGTTEPDNPFLKLAEQQAFKPAMNVDERLAAMRFRGGGDTAVHMTQLSVAASMLSTGHEPEEVVAKILAATKAIAPDGWNWREEEKAIEKMCNDWLKKHERRTVSRISANGGSAKVVSLADRRAEKEAEKEERQGKDPPPKKGKNKDQHLILGQGVLDTLASRNDSIMVIGDQVWRCSQGLWYLMTSTEVKSWLDMEIESGCRILNIKSSQRLVNEARAWILRNPEIHKSEEEVKWDAHKKIATRSGLLDPVTLQIEEITPAHYVQTWIDCEYQPGAKCPLWERMLSDLFPNDKNTIQAIQELFGVALLPEKPRNLMRALVFVGPSNSGKSNLLNVIGGLLTDRPNTTTFDTLETPHGTMDFQRNVPWVLHEAFDQSKWHASATVKALLSGDPININIKNGAIIEHKFRSAVFWGANMEPQFKDSSKALANRIEIIHCRTTFDPEVQKGIAAEATAKGYDSPSRYILDTEKSGVLNFAIKGMQRARANGFLFKTTDMKESSASLQKASNFAQRFIEEAFEYDPDFMVSKPDFTAAFRSWWEEEHGGHAPSEDMIGKSIVSMYEKRIATDNSKLRFNNVRYYAGIKMNEVGLSLWEAWSGMTAVKGTAARLSDDREKVNTKIPESWNTNPLIKAMKESHKK